MATIQETLDKNRNGYKTMEAFGINVPHQLTTLPLPPVKPQKCEGIGIDGNKNIIKLYINNEHNLTEKHKYVPIIYKEKPIGFVSDIKDKVEITLWTNYINIVPKFYMMDQLLEIKGINLDKDIRSFQMLINDEYTNCNNVDAKRDTIEEYKNKVLKCFDQLMPHMYFYSDFYPNDLNKARKCFMNLLTDVLNEDYKTLEKDYKIKLEK